MPNMLGREETEHLRVVMEMSNKVSSGVSAIIATREQTSAGGGTKIRRQENLRPNLHHVGAGPSATISVPPANVLVAHLLDKIVVRRLRNPLL